MTHAFALVALVVASLAPSLAAETFSIELQAAKDATLVQNPSEEMGSGASNAIYVGRVGSPGVGLRRRGLIQFDVAASIPAGSTIVSAMLTMEMLQTTSGPHSVTLFRAASQWSEGPSGSSGGQGVPAVPGDATWIHSEYPTQEWIAPGGDYARTTSATTSVGDPGTYSWSTATMASDVQAWLDDPSANFGWLIHGNENVQHTAKKFGSREVLPVEIRPRLTLSYVPCDAPDLDCNGHVDSADIAILLGAWGTSDSADLNDDGVVDAADLSILLGAWTG